MSHNSGLNILLGMITSSINDLCQRTSAYAWVLDQLHSRGPAGRMLLGPLV